MRLKLWHAAVFVLALVGFAIAYAPAAVFAPRSSAGFSYARAEGTVWRARFEGVRLGPYDAGDLNWRLSALELLNGRLNGEARFRGGAVRGGVRMIANLAGDRRIVAEQLEVDGAPLGTLMLAGATSARGIDVAFVGGRCHFGQGDLRSDVLSRNAAALSMRGPELSGGGICDGETAKFALAGAQGDAQVRVLLELRPNGEGRWRADAFNATGEAEITAALAGLNGELRWFPF